MSMIIGGYRGVNFQCTMLAITEKYMAKFVSVYYAGGRNKKPANWIVILHIQHQAFKNSWPIFLQRKIALKIGLFWGEGLCIFMVSNGRGGGGVSKYTGLKYGLTLYFFFCTHIIPKTYFSIPNDNLNLTITNFLYTSTNLNINFVLKTRFYIFIDFTAPN